MTRGSSARPASRGPTELRAARAMVFGVVAALAGCDDASSLGALAPPDASAAEDVVRARVAGPLRCAPAPVDEPGIRVDPAASPYAITRVVRGPRGGPWVEGDAYPALPSTALFLADPTCGVRVARYTIHIGTGPAVRDECVVGAAGAAAVRARFNGTNAGLCLQFGGATPGFAMAPLDQTLARVTPFERSPWTGACCVLREQREAAIGVDASGGRWFRRYGFNFAPVMDGIRLPAAPEVFAPAVLANVGTWLSLWRTRADGGEGLRVEWISDDGEPRAFGHSPSGWFPNARSLRLLSSREHENGLLALLRVEGARGASLGVALLCPNDTARTRHLVDLDVERAVLRLFGSYFALITQRTDGGEGVIELTLLASDLSWRREPRQLLREPGLRLHDAIAFDDPGELLVWHSVASEGAQQLRVGSLVPER
jgi:hypothetical protein